MRVSMCGCIFYARTIRVGYALREVPNYVCIILLYPPLEFHCSTYEHAVSNPKYIRVVEDYACIPLDGRTRCTWSVNDLIFNFHTHTYIYTRTKVFYRTRMRTFRTCDNDFLVGRILADHFEIYYYININNNIIILVQDF